MFSRLILTSPMWWDNYKYTCGNVLKMYWITHFFNSCSATSVSCACDKYCSLLLGPCGMQLVWSLVRRKPERRLIATCVVVRNMQRKIPFSALWSCWVISEITSVSNLIIVLWGFGLLYYRWPNCCVSMMRSYGGTWRSLRRYSYAEYNAECNMNVGMDTAACSNMRSPK